MMERGKGEGGMRGQVRWGEGEEEIKPSPCRHRRPFWPRRSRSGPRSCSRAPPESPRAGPPPRNSPGPATAHTPGRERVGDRDFDINEFADNNSFSTAAQPEHKGRHEILDFSA